MLFVLVVGLIVAASFSAVLLPIKDLILTEGTQSMLFWPAFALLIGIPILGLILFLVRKITGNRMQNKYAGMTLGFFWILGIVLAITLAVSVSRDFSTENGVREQVSIQQPSGGRLIISRNDDLLRIDEHDIFDALHISEDTVVCDNIRIRMEKSDSDQFSVVIEKAPVAAAAPKRASWPVRSGFRSHSAIPCSSSPAASLSQEFQLPRPARLRDRFRTGWQGTGRRPQSAGSLWIRRLPPRSLVG